MVRHAMGQRLSPGAAPGWWSAEVPPGWISAWGKRGLLPGDFVGQGHRHQRRAVHGRHAQIQVHAPDGTYLRGWSTPTMSSAAPSGLCLDRDGNFIVADSHYYRLLIYDRQVRPVPA
ncbi:MAG: hypothetical protein U1D30_02040 [Planctomycetota bacterium]